MIETNTQKQPQDTASTVSKEPSLPGLGPEVDMGMTVTCAICEAVYAPSPLQLPFLQYAQESLEATFMGACHFCFRCRRAACPQCWDEVHSVCGACVQEARLPFRAEAAPLDSLMFPPTSSQRLPAPQQQQAGSLFVPVHAGRFYLAPQFGQARPDIDTNSAVQQVIIQTITPGEPATDGEKSDLPVATPTKTPLPEASQDDRKQKKTPYAAKKGGKSSRLELAFTWIVLVILLVLVVVIALAEYIPAVNALVARLTHIDIHAEIAYLVHIVLQFFKK